MGANEGGSVLSYLVTPFLLFLLTIVFLASINKSIGVRKAYVQLLLKIFEYGRQNIETARRRTRKEEHRDNEDENSSENGSPDSEKPQQTDKRIVQNGNGHLPHSHSSNGNSLISRDALILLPDGDTIGNKIADREKDKEAKDVQKESPEKSDDEISFNLAKCLDYVKAGVEAIIEDEVTSRFEAEELKNWNLLTRTNRYYEFISWRLTVMWICGFVIRYIILMPLRVLICFIGVCWTVASNAFIGLIPSRAIRMKLSDVSFKLTFRLITRSLSALITIHNEEYKPRNCGFCVANHTTPIDIAMLSTDCTFSLIGQRHGGFLGVLQRALGRASPHIWFERAEAKDRHAVAQRLRQHVSDPRNPPILIFPEGTCINNTSVMQFKKGSFEVGGVIYPVAIKYDPRFGDAFWNSSRYSMMQYLYMMMTSWAIVCDVWYLPPMYRQEGETAIDFANRVKSVIAKQGGLVDLVWDGQLKRMKPKKEWKEKQQVEFTKRLKGE